MNQRVDFAGTESFLFKKSAEIGANLRITTNFLRWLQDSAATHLWRNWRGVGILRIAFRSSEILRSWWWAASFTGHLPMRRALQVVLAITVGGLALLFWPWPPYSRSKVDPSLQALVTPYRSVVTEYYLDGGSVGIRITDRNGTAMEFALPVSAGKSRRYERVLVGVMHARDVGKSPVPAENGRDTKNMLIRVVERYSSGDVDSMAALLALRGAPRDYVRVYFNSWFRPVGRGP